MRKEEIEIGGLTIEIVRKRNLKNLYIRVNPPEGDVKNKLDYYHDPDKTYIRIMENMPGISVQDFNSICKRAGVNELGSTVKEIE